MLPDKVQELTSYGPLPKSPQERRLALVKDEFGRTVGHYAAEATTAEARGM